MQLWLQWWSVVASLRQTCRDKRTFLWLCTALAGFCVRPDLLGVTSTVRGLGLAARCYDRLLDFFHSPAIEPDALSRLWTKLALQRFTPHRLGGRLVLLGDGIKIPKSGRQMPAVKRLHQASENNTKPEFIMGHSVQVVSLLVDAAGSFLAVPLSGRIHEGVKFSNRDHRTLPQKFCTLADSLGIVEPFVMIADAYYACASVANWALARGCALISRLRRNAVAFEQVPVPHGPRPRGRPRLYGEKIKLRTLFDASTDLWQQVESPVYGEHDVQVRLLSRDLLWRPLRRVVRFVLVDHPTRGRCIFFSTDLTLSAIDIVSGYGLRFKIELSFKQALRILGAYNYHFWMRGMKKISRNSGTQHMHRQSELYRNAVRRKLSAYDRHIQIGLIAQGLLQYLSACHPRLVWSSFGSWLRTIREGVCPSELVTAIALRNTLPAFLLASSAASIFTKFVRDNIDPAHASPLRLSG